MAQEDAQDPLQPQIAATLEDNPVRAAMALGLAYHAGDIALVEKVALALGQAGQLASAAGVLRPSGHRLMLDLHHVIKRIPAKPGDLDRVCRRRARAIDELIQPQADSATWSTYVAKRAQAWRVRA